VGYSHLFKNIFINSLIKLSIENSQKYYYRYAYEGEYPCTGGQIDVDVEEADAARDEKDERQY
jgi:hypothetical protein